MSVESEWQLYEMIPERDALEETCVYRTRGESQPLADENPDEAREDSE